MRTEKAAIRCLESERKSSADLALLVRARRQLLPEDPTVVAYYFEFPDEFVIALRESGTVDFYGRPRRKTLPDRVGSYAIVLPAATVQKARDEFDAIGFPALRYLDREEMLVGGGGFGIGYRDRDGKVKEFATRTGREVPAILYELRDKFFQTVRLREFTCSRHSSDCSGLVYRGWVPR
jgi:hypothetical protein